MSVDIDKASRLNIADFISIDGIEFWDILDLPEYVPNAADLQHVFVDGDRLDLLAQQYYQEPVLAWAIAWANNIELNPSDIVIGQVLVIPDSQYLNKLITTASTGT